MWISLPSYLASIHRQQCNAYTKNLLSHVCINNSYHLFSALSINADHPMAGQNREQRCLPARGRREGERDIRTAERMEELEPRERGPEKVLETHAKPQEPDL